jgi:hypothetical protein
MAPCMSTRRAAFRVASEFSVHPAPGTRHQAPGTSQAPGTRHQALT